MELMFTERCDRGTVAPSTVRFVGGGGNQETNERFTARRPKLSDYWVQEAKRIIALQ
jgi:hypothetical protein